METFTGNFKEVAGLVPAFQEFGQEPWLVFSGVANTQDKWNYPDTGAGYPKGSAVLFMGDVIISGTLFGKRQVITVDKDVDGDFHVHDSMFVSGNFYSSPTTYGADISDVLTIQRGDTNQPPKVGFRKTGDRSPSEHTAWMGTYKDCFVVFSGSKGTRGLPYGGIGLFEGDVHVSGNLSVDGSLGLTQRDTILNNSASATGDGYAANTAGARGTYPHDWGFPAADSAPRTNAGPSFGHATTASAAGTSLAPFYVQQDRWQVHANGVLSHAGNDVPAFWYSDFVNSSSLDQIGVGLANTKRLGGFRFIVAASGSGTENYDYKRGRGAANSSVFMVSGTGDIALDPGRALVFDSRYNGLAAGNPEYARRVQIKHEPHPSTTHNGKLIFSGAQGKPLHYHFIRGSVTGSGGFYLPPADGTQTQGQMGQGLGIVFAGPAGGDAQTGIFYSITPGDSRRFKTLAETFAITASIGTSNIAIGAGNNMNIRAHSGSMTTESWGSTTLNTVKNDSNVIIKPGNTTVGDRGFQVQRANDTKLFLVDTYNNQVKVFNPAEDDDFFQIKTAGKGATELTTVDSTGTGGSLTVFPDGALIMSGTGNVSIDSDPTVGGIVAIGGGAHGQSVELGRWNVGIATKIAMTGSNIQAKAGTGGLDFDIGGNTNLHTNPGNTVISTTGGTTEIIGAGSPSTIKIHNNDTTNGIEIGLNTPTSGVPVFIGGSTSLVTIGNDLNVGTMAHSGSMDIWGDLTVHGHFVKGHIISASMGDPLLFLNSGSLTKNTGGGIAISSGSNVTWDAYVGGHPTYSPAMVFGRDTTTARDTFLVGRQNTHDGTAASLVGAIPIDVRAAGYRTVAGMTMTASKQPGAGVYNVKVGNTGSAGRLTLHAGTTDGGGTLGPMIFSGSSFAFTQVGSNPKVYLDDDFSGGNDVYFQAGMNTAGGNNRLDLKLAAEGLRLQTNPRLEFGSATRFIANGEPSAAALLIQNTGQALQMSASQYSFGMSGGQRLYFNEAAAGAASMRVDGNLLKIDLTGLYTGLRLDGAKTIELGDAGKYINETGMFSDGGLQLDATGTVALESSADIKLHAEGPNPDGTPTSSGIKSYAYNANDKQSAANRNTGAILVLSSSAAAAPDVGYAALGFSEAELEYEFAASTVEYPAKIPVAARNQRNQDVTFLVSGTMNNSVLKARRGNALFMGDVIMSGNLSVGNYIYHEGNALANAETAIQFLSTEIKLRADGKNYLSADGASSNIALVVNPDAATIGFTVNGTSATKPIMQGLGHDSTNRAVFHNTFTTAAPHLDPANGEDVLLFFSGSSGTRYQAGDTGDAIRGTALFGGDAYVSGTLGAANVALENLTLSSATAYLRFYDSNHYVQKSGGNLLFRDSALGTSKSLTQLASLAMTENLFSVTQTAVGVPNYGMTTGSFSFDSGFDGYSSNDPRPTNLVSINDSGVGNSDVYFFVSGAIGMRTREPADIASQLNRRSISLFGGDVHISGTLTSDNTTFGGSLDTSYDTDNAGNTTPGGGRTIIADAGYVEIRKTDSLPIADSKLFGVTGSASFGQIKIAPVADANGFYTYGGVFVTGSAGRLGFGVGGAAAADIAFTVNSNNNIEIGASSGNSRKLYWDPNEANTFIQYTNTNASQPGPKILHIANRTAGGRISFSAGSSGGANGSGFEGNVAVSGSILPGFDSEYNLGSPGARWANVYAGDLHLRNDRGNWTIYEEPDMLVVVNNLTGKRYKMGLTPLEDDE
jgi:hypothetical protein